MMRINQVDDGRVISGGIPLGVLRQDKVFVATKTEEKHYFKLYKGYALNSDLLNWLLWKNCTQIVLLVRNKDGLTKAYKATILDWIQARPYVNLLRGKSEEQRVLTVKQLEELNKNG